MDLSVVVPTLNGRDRLAACLDALAAHAPEAEVIVANGPSADGTTGMVRDRDDVDVLVEISDRTVNVARNAGIEVATGDIVALVDYDNRIGEGWLDAVRAGLDDADVVTGPVTPIEPEQGGRDGEASANGERIVRDDEHDDERDDEHDDERDDEHDDERDDEHDDDERDGPERRTIAGTEVTYFEGGNVAFRREALRDLDGSTSISARAARATRRGAPAGADGTNRGVARRPGGHQGAPEPDGGRLRRTTAREWGGSTERSRTAS